jgi:hypothetical protein
MGFGGPTYSSLNAPVPAAAVDTHIDYEPLVRPGEKRGEADEYYNPRGTYDPPPPPPPLGGQYSTAWDYQK